MVNWRILDIDWFNTNWCPHSVYRECHAYDICVLCGRIRYWPDWSWEEISKL